MDQLVTVWTFLTMFFQYPIIQGATIGFMNAAVLDIVEFKKFQKWDDVAKYDFGVASFRWFQGIIVGMLTGSGISLVTNS